MNQIGQTHNPTMNRLMQMKINANFMRRRNMTKNNITAPHRWENGCLQTQAVLINQSQRSTTCASQAITKIENSARGGCCTKAPHIKADCCWVGI